MGASAVYFAPVVFGDKQIAQDDILMGLAKGREIVEFRAGHGSEPLWNNAMFSGMPTFEIATVSKKYCKKTSDRIFAT